MMEIPPLIILRELESVHPDVARLLLDNNTDLRGQDNSGSTSLHFAVESGFLGIAQFSPTLSTMQTSIPRTTKGSTHYTQHQIVGGKDVQALCVSCLTTVRMCRRATPAERLVAYRPERGRLLSWDAAE